MNKWCFSLMLLIAVNSQMWGQRIVPTPEDLYADAVEFIYSGDYNDALDILLSLHNRGFQTSNISYLIGECYLNIQGQKTRSIPFLKEAVRNISVNYSGNTLQEESAPCKSLLYLGIASRLNYDFDNALRYFNEYIQNVDDSDKENARSAEYHIERCNFALELMAAPAEITADTLAVSYDLNGSCFNPLVTPDENTLVFMDQLKFYDAVMIVQKGDSNWSAPLNLTPEIKSDGDHYVTGISSEGGTMLLNYYDPYLSGEIFTAQSVKGDWGAMQKLRGPVNTVFNETHASFSPNGKVLYFTSDRKGGYGGTDIYKAFKNEKGEWEKVVNLGPLINSPFNEESPFVSSDGSKLFFSSQGHYNMGGFDIFCSAQDDEGDWLPPVNVGYPLNTTDDDLFFFPVGDGKIGYQSRFARNSHQSELIRYVIHSFGNPAHFIVNGKIGINADPGFNPATLSVAFINKNGKDTIAVNPLNEDGSFRQKLPSGSFRVDISDKMKVLLSKDIDIPDYFPHNNLVFREELTLHSEMVSDTVYLDDILFEFNTSNPEQESIDDIDKVASILYRYPEATIRINGYADAIGSEKYNLKLSLQRANSIKEVLESRIEKTLRILTVPHGESDPVAINVNTDGSDNPEGRHYNRRVEIQFESLPGTIHVIRVSQVPAALQHK